MKLVNFQEIFSTEVQPPSVILVEGVAGTLKSALCFSLMLHELQDPAKHGLYITFEQTWDSHLVNMKSLGLETADNLLSLDYNIMRREFKNSETNVKIFDSILGMLESLIQEKKDGFRIFALDSLNALYSVMDPKEIEYSLAGFFRKLRELNIISLIIFEKSEAYHLGKLRERFMADGIISLGIQKNRGDVVRYLQPLKFNAADHSLKKRCLEASDNGLALLGPVYR